MGKGQKKITHGEQNIADEDSTPQYYQAKGSRALQSMLLKKIERAFKEACRQSYKDKEAGTKDDVFSDKPSIGFRTAMSRSGRHLWRICRVLPKVVVHAT